MSGMPACIMFYTVTTLHHVINSLFLSTCRCFDSDGEYAVGGTSRGKLLFWKLDDPSGHEQVLEIPDAHAQGVSALTVSLHASTIVSASVDGGIRIWHLRRKATSRGRLPAFF